MSLSDASQGRQAEGSVHKRHSSLQPRVSKETLDERANGVRQTIRPFRDDSSVSLA
jgi:hypothetical protein